jgi:drug/metabolite transporter (DMT)-like permease
LITGEYRKLLNINSKGIQFSVLGGLLMFLIYPILSFSALQLIPATVNSILVATNVIFATLIAIPILNEKLSVINYAGVLLAFMGVPFVVLSSGWGGISIQDLNSFGVSLSLLGAIVAALYTIVGKAAMSKYDALSVTLIASFAGGMLQIVVSGLAVGYAEIFTISIPVFIMVLYWGIFSGVGYYLYYSCLKNLEAARASSFIYFAPLFAVVSSFMILGEPLGILLIIGMILIFLGVHLTQKKEIN